MKRLVLLFASLLAAFAIVGTVQPVNAEAANTPCILKCAPPPVITSTPTSGIPTVVCFPVNKHMHLRGHHKQHIKCVVVVKHPGFRGPIPPVKFAFPIQSCGPKHPGLRCVQPVKSSL